MADQTPRKIPPTSENERKILLPILLLFGLIGLLLALMRQAIWLPLMGGLAGFLLGLAFGLTFSREIIWAVRHFGPYCRREGWIKGAIAIVALVGLFIIAPIFILSIGVGVIIRLLLPHKKSR
jgi:hypothetical protein